MVGASWWTLEVKGAIREAKTWVWEKSFFYGLSNCFETFVRPQSNYGKPSGDSGKSCSTNMVECCWLQLRVLLGGGRSEVAEAPKQLLGCRAYKWMSSWSLGVCPTTLHVFCGLGKDIWLCPSEYSVQGASAVWGVWFFFLDVWF